jgi:hypothetical protein
MSTQDSPPSGQADNAEDQQVYRVNRAGQEVFSGQLADLEYAIKTRQVRADDLIFDDGSGSWTFARNHEVFVRLLGESLDDLKRSRRASDRRLPLARWLFSVALMSGLLYLLIHYSKRVEFKSRGDTFSDSDSTERPRDLSSATRDPSQDPAQDPTGGAAEGGEGRGGGSASGEGDELDLVESTLAAEARALAARKALGPDGEPLEMVFDLEAEGMRGDDALSLTEGQRALSDERLLAMANTLYLKDTQGREGLNDLLRALSLTEFVARRALHRDQREHAEAKLTIAHLNERFLSRCAALKSAEECRVQVQHPRWPEATLKAITARRALRGMSKAQVEAAWGRAQSVSAVEGGSRACYDPRCERSVLMVGGVVAEVSEGGR